MSLIKLSKIYKSYNIEGVCLPVLKSIDLNIHSGEFVSIMGASGSGKTTLLNIIGCLDTYDDGSYTLGGNNIINKTSADSLVKIRREKIGYIFQQFNLIPCLNASRNVELPLIYNGVSKSERRMLVEAAIERVGLLDRSHHRPNQLSGGQQQRIAIARALVNKPDILIADEPTGNLDTKTGADILNIFRSLNSEGMTIIMVTHERNAAAFSKRTIHLCDGKVV